MTKLTVAIAILAAASVAACSGSPALRSAGRSAAVTGNRPAANLHRGGSLPSAPAGAEAIIGDSARDLTRQFGPPRLDLTEGAAHKLQFASDACVLDAYLYAPRAGGDPVVTHVDTRSPDGSDVDRAACIAALQRR
jgi:hypothetical protein